MTTGSDWLEWPHTERYIEGSLAAVGPPVQDSRAVGRRHTEDSLAVEVADMAGSPALEEADMAGSPALEEADMAGSPALAKGYTEGHTD